MSDLGKKLQFAFCVIINIYAVEMLTDKAGICLWFLLCVIYIPK